MTASLAKNFTEVIFIGMPGPNHNYGGLSADNMAASRNEGSVSRPREAGLQALALARLLRSLGQTVALLPPQIRPYMPELRKYFDGDDAGVIAQAAQEAPHLLEAMSSSSAMWVANAATVTPPQDNEDGMLHLTVANLHTNIHRRIEAMATYLTLRAIFANVPHCHVGMPLDAASDFRDEGAANHMRLAPNHAAGGLNVFVYGNDGNPRDPATARQTLATSQEIIARHHIGDHAAIYVKQSPLAIEAGVFHNDVIAVSHEDFLLVHEDAYSLGSADINYIAESYTERTGAALTIRVVKDSELTLEEAIDSYFFNSQIVTLPAGGMAVIAPGDAKEVHGGKAWELLKKIVAEPGNPLRELHSVDLRQSMKNGGGPACLRLRVLMDDEQLASLKNSTHALADDALLEQFAAIIEEYYPEQFNASGINGAMLENCTKTVLAMEEALGITVSHPQS